MERTAPTPNTHKGRTHTIVRTILKPNGNRSEARTGISGGTDAMAFELFEGYVAHAQRNPNVIGVTLRNAAGATLAAWTRDAGKQVA